ncbi:hypothetical protein ABF87_08005 [Nitrosomonas sp. JL21]|uniref:hypothetical protein n=1 Tax=Nitrosomonas sp. JL21 TaxID=153949 RepID=UPI00136D2E00|nr:hypothetical protein [Nitrosomonas sp. JL21]MXS77907.1 hypothetical protein [Nitrosomonas sp. JL21]
MNGSKPCVAITEHQFAIVVITINKLKREAIQCLWKLVPLIFSIVIFLSATGVEVAIAYGVFSGLLAGIEDPIVQHSAGLLSMTAVIAMLTYHWISENNPDAWSVRLIKNLSTVFAPLYVFAGGLFLGIILFPGVIAVTTSGTLDTIFGLPVEQVNADNVGQALITWLQDNLILAAPLFLAGVMGISVMSLFVGGQCINVISTNAYAIFRALSKYLVSRRAGLQMQLDIKASRKMTSELAQLEKRNDSFYRNHAAIVAAGLVDQYVRRAEAAIEANPALFTRIDEPDSAVSRLFGKQPDLSVIQARIDVLRTQNVKHIRSVIDRILK